MENKRIKALLKKLGKTAGLLTGVVGSTADVDRYGDIVNQDTWQLDNFKENPIILWAHNASMTEDRPPIGKATRVEVKNGVLEFDIQFDMADDFAANIFRKYAEGFLSAFSVGFIPHERAMSEDGKMILLNNELLELSAVPVPANPNALNQLRTLSFAAYEDFDKFLDTAEKKGEEIEEVTLKDAEIDRIAVKVASVLTSKGIIKVASESEDQEGDDEVEKSHSSAPASPQLGATPKFVAVVRETTKQMQDLLADYNRSQKAQ